MISRLGQWSIEYIYWRLIPYFLKKYFDLETVKIGNFLSAGEVGRNPGEITKTQLRNILGNVDTILEVGANDGRDTLELSLMFPDAIIHAIECDVRLIGLFYQRMNRFQNVSLHTFAAWNSNGFKKFYSSSGTSFGSSSLLEPKMIRDVEPGITFDSRMPVVTATLSELIESLDLDVIDLVWMDVQGAEFTILQDLLPYLKRIRSIYLEVEQHEMYQGEALYSEILEYFHANGFSVARELSNGSQIVNALFIQNIE